MAKYASPPVLAAVILTTMLPNVAVLRTADDWFLKRFQSWGRIPHGVRNLAERITPESLPLHQTHLDALKAWIAHEGDVPSELAGCISATASESTSTGYLTRVLHLYRELEKLEEAQSHANAFRTHAEDWHTIKDEFIVFMAQSHAFFVLFDHLKLVDGPAGDDAFRQAGDRYRVICRKVFHHMTEFLAAALLMVDASESRIKSRLSNMGFHIPDLSCPQVAVGPFVFMGVMIMLAILGVVAIVHPETGPVPLPITALLIGLTKTVGVVSAVFPKLRWSWFRPDSKNRPPYLAWIASATLAVIVSFLVERSALGFLDHKLHSAIDFGKFPVTPLAPTTFTLCLAIGILCDVDLRLGNGWLRRVSEGVLCGVTMVMSIAVCLQLLDISSATAGQTAPWFPFVLSFSIGFLCGVVSPHLYRRARGDLPAGRAHIAHQVLQQALAEH